MTAPVHPQLMDPVDDPEEFIRASIYWYPRLFPSRTEVLDHTLLCNGNGYEWNAAGQLRSVFSHIEPDYDRLDNYESRALEWEARATAANGGGSAGFFLEMARDERAEQARLLTVRASYLVLARTYNPVHDTTDYGPAYGGPKARMIGTSELSWTLLGRALKMPNDMVTSITGPPPTRIAPAWQQIVDETRLLFADVLVEQGTLF